MNTETKEKQPWAVCLMFKNRLNVMLLGIFLIALSVALCVTKWNFPEMIQTPLLWFIASLYFLAGATFLMGAYISRKKTYWDTIDP